MLKVSRIFKAWLSYTLIAIGTGLGLGLGTGMAFAEEIKDTPVLKETDVRPLPGSLDKNSHVQQQQS